MGKEKTHISLVVIGHVDAGEYFRRVCKIDGFNEITALLHE